MVFVGKIYQNHCFAKVGNFVPAMRKVNMVQIQFMKRKKSQLFSTKFNKNNLESFPQVMFSFGRSYINSFALKNIQL